MKIEEIAKNSLKEKGYLLTSFDGAHMAEIEAIAMFKRGANYVLEKIEQLIYEKHVEGNLPLFELTHLIDKLKEK